MAAIVEGKHITSLEGASDAKIYIPFSPELLSLLSLLRENEELRAAESWNSSIQRHNIYLYV